MSSTVYVDADSCPVKEEIIKLCGQYEKELVFVFSYAHNMVLPEHVKTVQVDVDKEAADLYLLQAVSRGDVCISQDHALASLLLIKGVTVLSPRGHVYMEEEMASMLQSRYAAQKARRAGRKTKGPRKFTATDREQFVHALEQVLSTGN
ncbi:MULTISPECIES: YaiI/YqxD family protein [Bacillaceae]|uniref:UPF0178 protein AN965_06700 n=2 Tax=Bacillaceae TaxID=186817 RepID=A0A9D5I1S7_9BACI|nr:MULTISPECIES: DUF188 domain-containing protein [Bacillaceae]KQL57997.1 hypothetical protein AN965_06700 [Alkalicoccobacillus plakortidis]MBG9785706.1 hypothetical protein [Shouchella lehensis]RQW19992.1 hypothetical protein EH196_07550 [Bacillus sp. C1-1]TES48169.1 hypothetical protein E2L03_13640 [Shouchella lehensis]